MNNVSVKQGILGNVTYGDKILENWEMYPLRFQDRMPDLTDTLQSLNVNQSNVPLLAMASFSISQAADTFLRLDGWTKVGTCFFFCISQSVYL